MWNQQLRLKLGIADGRAYYTHNVRPAHYEAWPSCPQLTSTRAQIKLRALAETYFNLHSAPIPEWTQLGADWNAFVRKVRLFVAAPRSLMGALRTGLRDVSYIQELRRTLAIVGISAIVFTQLLGSDKTSSLQETISRPDK